MGRTVGQSYIGVIYKDIAPIMENQMDKKIESEMEAGVYRIVITQGL